MELTEISDRIDIKLNTFEVPIEVDEYEKSIYLTKAQKLIYKQLCDEFEGNGIISNYLQPFLVDYHIETTFIQSTDILKNSIHVEVPSNIYRTVIERITLGSSSTPVNTKYENKEVKVIKSRIGEIQYKVDNPFRVPNNKEVLRVTSDNQNNTLVTETFHIILPEGTFMKQYFCRYLIDIPSIVLENLDTTLSIEGMSIATNSLFSDEVMEKIIDLAVMSILQDKTVFNQSKNV